MPKCIEKTINAKLYQPTQRKKKRLEYLYKEWNKSLEEHKEGESYKERRKKHTINSAFIQDVKRVDSKEEKDHPVYIRSQLLKIEKTDNKIAKYFVGIPIEPHERVWLPLKFAWRQEKNLINGIIKDSLICKHEDGFYLHITIEIPENTEIPENPTFIGVDVGERNSLTSVALKNGEPERGRFWDGGEYKRINKKYGGMRSRLQKRGADELLEEIKNKQYRKKEDLRNKQSRELIEYAKQFDDSVIVMENLTNIRDSIDYGKRMNRRLHNWSFKSLQSKIEYKAREEGIPVVWIDPWRTSKKCHNCWHKGTRKGNKFKCTNENCPVTEYNADLNASVNIALKGAFSLRENANLGKDYHNDRQENGAPLTVLKPRTVTSFQAR